MTQKENIIIIGSGPAGLTAAIYAARANLNPLMISGNEFGGQIAITSEVENYPGFDSILGPDLTEKMKAQAEKFGTRIQYDYVSEVDFTKGSPFKLKTYSQDYEAKTVIIATGASRNVSASPAKMNLLVRACRIARRATDSFQE